MSSFPPFNLKCLLIVILNHIDGYPDLLVAINDSDTGSSHMSLWLSVACDRHHQCNDAATYMKRRTFIRSHDGVKELEAIRGAYAATFYDINGISYHIIQYHCSS
jgi:hypothetical protein